MNYWLFKTEPASYSWENLKDAKGKKCVWEGVRNYQARNFMRTMKLGDLGFFYHSNVKIPVIKGIVSICREAHPDYFSWQPESKYYDVASTPENPRWFMVELKFEKEFNPPVSRDELKKDFLLSEMELLKKGSRLSVQPVRPEEWKIICDLRN